MTVADEPSPPGLGQALVAELRSQRAELRESIGAVELALASPADQANWRQRVATALVELSGDLRTHVDLTEGPGGLYAELLGASPRLAGEVKHLTREHGEIGGQITALLEVLDSPGRSVSDVRARGTELLGRLVRHRQRGADLVYDAYDIDLGGET